MGNTRLQVVSVKLTREQSAKVARLAEQRKVSKSQVVRDLIDDAGTEWPKGAVGEKVGHLFGAVKKAPRDLATNPKYLKGFGEWRRR